MTLAAKVGAQLLASEELAPHAWLFGEDQARYLVTTPAADAVLAAAEASGVPARIVGEAGGDVLARPGLFSIPLAKLRTAHEGWLPGFMGA